MEQNNLDDTIKVLTMMGNRYGTCETERDAIRKAITIIKWKQKFDSIISEIYNFDELISRKELPSKVVETLLEAANYHKYGSRDFRLGEVIKYKPTEVEDILERAIEEGDL